MKDLDWNYFVIVNGDTPHLKVIPEGVGINDEGVKGRVWSGKIAKNYDGGIGTKNDPYLIATPEQLAKLILSCNEDPNTYFKLTYDIYLNDVSDENWKENGNRWFGEWLTFRGQFDGNGHVVRGLLFDTQDVYITALFPRLGYSSSITNLGVADSYLNNPANGEKHTFVAPIVGLIEEQDANKGQKAPYISQCFSDASVVVNGRFAGGIVAGTGFAIEVENSYSVADITYGEYGGGLIGNSWTNKIVIKNSWSATKNREYVVDNIGIYSAQGITNVYTDSGFTYNRKVENLNLSLMQGNLAAKSMQGLDFVDIWKTVDGGTPVLRQFKDCEQYTSKREPTKNSISFATFGGSKCEPLYGYAGVTPISKEDLPIPTKEGYKFVEWYHYSDLHVPFCIDTFVNADIVLYAKYEPVGFEIGFENNLDEKYDFNAAATHFKPGVMNYNPRYVHGGMKSMAALAGDESPIFLLSYENTLEIGKEYTMSFWISTSDDTAEGIIEILHASQPHVYSKTVFAQTEEFSGVKKFNWKQYTVKFTANAPYLLIKTEGKSNLYFDDFTVIPTGKDGTLSDKIQQSISLQNTNKFVIIASCISAIVLILAGVSTVILIRRRKFKKQI